MKPGPSPVPSFGKTLVVLCVLTPASEASDWPVIVQSYRQIEWIAGLSGEAAENANEWNFAEGRPAIEAELSEPHSAMADLAGNIYIADKNAHSIRKISRDGILITVAGVNEAGFNGDGAGIQCQLDGPQHAYPLPDGTLYILDSGNRRIRRLGTDGNLVTRITETKALSRGLWVSRDESLIYYATQTTLKRWTPLHGPGPGTPLADGLDDAANLDVAPNGDIYIADRGSSRVYRVPPNNTPAVSLIPVAGLGADASDGPKASGDPALSVGMREARGIAFHPAGGYFVATHRGGDLWYVDTLGRAWMFIEGDASTTHFPTPQPVPTTKQVMGEPRSVSVALNGDVLICGNDAGYIRRVRYLGPPLAQKSTLSISSHPSSGLSIHWQVDATRWFQLESTDNPGATHWVPRFLGPGSGDIQHWVDSTTPLNPVRFYRLIEFRAWPN